MSCVEDEEKTRDMLQCREGLFVTPPSPPRSVSQKQKTTRFRAKYALECVIWGLIDFKIFRGSMPPNPSRAYKRLALPAVMSINYLKTSPPPRLLIPGSATVVQYKVCFLFWWSGTIEPPIQGKSAKMLKWDGFHSVSLFILPLVLVTSLRHVAFIHATFLRSCWDHPMRTLLTV